VPGRLITADCHIAPPYSLIDELPESYREYFPRVETQDDGTEIVKAGAMVSMAMLAGDGSGTDISPDATGAVGNVCPQARPSFDPAEQLADLERDGVYGAVLIGRITDMPNNIPADADAAYCRVVNDWLAETWEPFLDRVAPGIHLPFKDVAASVAELERAAGMGLRPALLPDGIFERPYYLPEWEPLWEAANSLKMPITMHVGGLRSPLIGPGLQAFPGRQDIGWYTQCCGMGETLGWLTYSGVFDRYPDLHVVMTEGYAGWLSFAIQFYDHHFSQSRLHDLGIDHIMGPAKIDAPPSVYLKRQAHATFMWDPLAIRARDITGLDCLMWGNDYPHHEGSFPFSAEWNAKQFDGVPEHEVDAIVRGNAAKIFGITV
jgi:predicted TIM-barrel fold metal-dependent hydrolase